MQKKDRQQGSSFVEVLITCVILAIVSISIMNSISTSNSQVSNANTRLKGLLALTSASEILAATPFSFCSSTVPKPQTYANALEVLNGTDALDSSSDSLKENTFPTGEVGKLEILDVSVVTRNGDSTNFQSCDSLSNLENQSKFNSVYWGIQKITIQFTRSNSKGEVLEVVQRSLIKTFDNKEKNYASSGTLKTKSVEVNCTSDFSPKIPGTSPAATNTITLEIGRERCFKFSVSDAPDSDFTFSILNADFTPTEIIPKNMSDALSGGYWLKPNILKIQAPEFLSIDSTRRNPAGKVNIDVSAYRISTAEMAVPASISIRVNAMKVTDWSTNSELRSNQSITAFNGEMNAAQIGEFIPMLASGGVFPYSYSISPTSVTYSGSISSGRTTITGISSTSGLHVGMTLLKLSGTGVFNGTTTITAINSSSQITISPTANTSGSIIFSPNFNSLTGLDLDNSTGLIKGIPCAIRNFTSTDIVYGFQVRDSGLSSATNPISIRIDRPSSWATNTFGTKQLVTTTSYSYKKGTTQTATIDLIQACGGTPPYTFSFVKVSTCNSLPSNISLITSSTNSTIGTLRVNGNMQNTTVSCAFKIGIQDSTLPTPWSATHSTTFTVAITN